MSRPLAYSVLGLVLAVGLLPLGLAFPLQIIGGFLLGWIFFLVRVVPATTVQWGGVATALLCLILIAVLGHGFARWLAGEVAPGRRWRARWTAGSIAGVILMFVAGIAAAGLGHQVGWLLTSRDPWVGSSMRSAARRAQSINNLKQIGLALLNYHEANGSLPAAATTDAEGRLMHGWQARILPDLELGAEFGAINFAVPWNDPANAAVIQTTMWTYQNPAILTRPPATEPAESHYAGNAWVLGGESAMPLTAIADGTAHTILVGEAAGKYRPWADPHNWRDPRFGINRSPLGFGSPYPGGASFLFADGSVKFLKNQIDPRVFEALCTPDGGEQIRAADY